MVREPSFAVGRGWSQCLAEGGEGWLWLTLDVTIRSSVAEGCLSVCPPGVPQSMKEVSRLHFYR